MAGLKGYRPSLHTKKRHEQRIRGFLSRSRRQLSEEFQKRRSGRLVKGFTVKEANEIQAEIPMDLWPTEWWWTSDGKLRFGEEMLDDF